MKIYALMISLVFISIACSDLETYTYEIPEDYAVYDYEAVDLGLSVKWANENIGATSPANYGNYYAWGEIASKSTYTMLNSVTFGDSSLGDISGNADYDAATANWGGSWRMPTEEEFEELFDDCTWIWTTQENSVGQEINGYKIEGTNGNSIFLPAAGWRISSDLNDAGEKVYYWTSSAGDDGSGLAIGFCNGLSWYYRDRGLPIRPVSE